MRWNKSLKWKINRMLSGAALNAVLLLKTMYASMTWQTLPLQPPAPVLPVSVLKVNCWYCEKMGTVWRLPQYQDGIYGHFCRECGHSLRDHKKYGAGKLISTPQNSSC